MDVTNILFVHYSKYYIGTGYIFANKKTKELIREVLFMTYKYSAARLAYDRNDENMPMCLTMFGSTKYDFKLRSFMKSSST